MKEKLINNNNKNALVKKNYIRKVKNNLEKYFKFNCK